MIINKVKVKCLIFNNFLLQYSLIHNKVNLILLLETNQVQLISIWIKLLNLILSCLLSGKLNSLLMMINKINKIKCKCKYKCNKKKNKILNIKNKLIHMKIKLLIINQKNS